jgi:hypothetical protein
MRPSTPPVRVISSVELAATVWSPVLSSEMTGMALAFDLKRRHGLKP